MLGSIQKACSGFLAGSLATFLFQQSALMALKMAGIAPYAQPWNWTPSAHYSVPFIILVTLVGGFWGMIIALIWPDVPGDSVFMRGAVGGLVGPGLIGSWTVVPWLQNQPMFADGDVRQVAVTAIVCVAYGIGTGLFIGMLDKRRAEAPSRRRVLI